MKIMTKNQLKEYIKQNIKEILSEGPKEDVIAAEKNAIDKKLNLRSRKNKAYALYNLLSIFVLS